MGSRRSRRKTTYREYKPEDEPQANDAKKVWRTAKKDGRVRVRPEDYAPVRPARTDADKTASTNSLSLLTSLDANEAEEATSSNASAGSDASEAEATNASIAPAGSDADGIEPKIMAILQSGSADAEKFERIVAIIRSGHREANEAEIALYVLMTGSDAFKLHGIRASIERAGDAKEEIARILWPPSAAAGKFEELMMAIGKYGYDADRAEIASIFQSTKNANKFEAIWAFILSFRSVEPLGEKLAFILLSASTANKFSEIKAAVPNSYFFSRVQVKCILQSPKTEADKLEAICTLILCAGFAKQLGAKLAFIFLTVRASLRLAMIMIFIQSNGYHVRERNIALILESASTDDNKLKEICAAILLASDVSENEESNGTVWYAKPLNVDERKLKLDLLANLAKELHTAGFQLVLRARDGSLWEVTGNFSTLEGYNIDPTVVEIYIVGNTEALQLYTWLHHHLSGYGADGQHVKGRGVINIPVGGWRRAAIGGVRTDLTIGSFKVHIASSNLPPPEPDAQRDKSRAPHSIKLFQT